MNEIKKHIDNLTFFVAKFSDYTIVHNRVTRRVLDYSKTKIMVLNDLVSLLSSQLAENNLWPYLQLHMTNLGNVDSSQPSSEWNFNNVLVLKQREL